MKNSATLIIFFICCTCPAFSQSFFQEGYLISNSNDTIHGYVDDKGSLKTFKKCVFKSNLESEAEDFLPDQIRAFRISNGQYYESIKIDINGADELVFLEKLLDGVIDVFYVSKTNDGYYILRNEEGELFELRNSKIEVTNENGDFIKEKKEYVYILRFLLRDDPSTIMRVDRLPFDTNAIIDITRDYHNNVCDSYECTAYSKKKEKIKIRLGLYAGYAVSNIKFESDYVEKMNQDFSSSSDIFIGASINFMDPNISSRFSVQLDLIIQNGKYVYEATYFDMQYLKIPFSILYGYPAKKIQPNLQLGIVYNNWIRHDAGNIIPEQVIGDALQKRSYQYGLLFRVGLTFKLSKKLNLFLLGGYENYVGKPWNIYSVPDGNGGYFTLQESVKTKTDFLNFSIGVQF